MVAVDTFTNVMRAIAFGLALGLLTFAIVWAIQEWTKHFRSKRKRPWDWKIDGECDNRSRIRVVSTTGFGDPGDDTTIMVAGQTMRMKVVGPEELEFVDYDKRFPVLP